MSGRAQKIAAAIAAACALAAGSAHAQQAAAGATVKDRSGWSASVFVPKLEKKDYAADPNIRAAIPPVVNATVSRRVARGTRLSLDVFNVLDRRFAPVESLAAPEWGKSSVPSDNYLFTPAEARGFRVRLRIAF